MGAIQLKNVTKKFGDQMVIDDLNLSIEDGSFTVLVGPSGCGKSTTLRMITGLDEPTSGDIYIDGKKINDLTPGKRDINITIYFQSIWYFHAPPVFYADPSGSH